MSRRLMLTGLVALALQGCGSDPFASTTTTPPARTTAGRPVAPPATGAGTGSLKDRKAAAAAAAEPVTQRLASGTFVPSAAGRPGPAVLLVRDAADTTQNAEREATALARLGVASMVVDADPQAFAGSVPHVRAALRGLSRRDGVDPQRVGVVGVGAGADLGAVILGSGVAVRAAVLAGLGDNPAVPARYVGRRWLPRAQYGTELLLQSAKLPGTEARKLVGSAPAGTQLAQYKTLDAVARADRDSWLKKMLGR